MGLPGQIGQVTRPTRRRRRSSPRADLLPGQLYAFGDNRYGELGNATNSATGNANPTPTLVGLPGQIGQVTQLAAGVDHSLALTSSGQLYAFGDNRYGELGNATNSATGNANPTPTLVGLPGQIGKSRGSPPATNTVSR